VQVIVGMVMVGPGWLADRHNVGRATVKRQLPQIKKKYRGL